jgi:hypothetical protein
MRVDRSKGDLRRCCPFRTRKGLSALLFLVGFLFMAQQIGPSVSRAGEQEGLQSRLRSGGFTGAYQQLAQLASAPWVATEVNGQVLRQDIATGSWREVPAGSTISPATKIKTGPNGFAKLTNGKDQVEIGGNGGLLIPARNAASPITRIVQTSGVLIYNVYKRPRQGFVVETPLMLVTVKGTRFAVTVTETLAQVTVVTGIVAVTDPVTAETVDIEPGQTATVSSQPGTGVAVDSTTSTTAVSDSSGTSTGQSSTSGVASGTGTGTGTGTSSGTSSTADAGGIGVSVDAGDGGVGADANAGDTGAGAGVGDSGVGADAAGTSADSGGIGGGVGGAVGDAVGGVF